MKSIQILQQDSSPPRLIEVEWICRSCESRSPNATKNWFVLILKECLAFSWLPNDQKNDLWALFGHDVSLLFCFWKDESSSVEFICFQCASKSSFGPSRQFRVQQWRVDQVASFSMSPLQAHHLLSSGPHWASRSEYGLGACSCQPQFHFLPWPTFSLCVFCCVAVGSFAQSIHTLSFSLHYSSIKCFSFQVSLLSALEFSSSRHRLKARYYCSGDPFLRTSFCLWSDYIIAFWIFHVWTEQFLTRSTKVYFLQCL